MSKIEFFETKIIKVKKGKYICRHELSVWDYIYNKTIRCALCGKTLTEKWANTPRELKEKGNWVNGENLDKIKFPCFCNFNYKGKGVHGIGIINKNFANNEVEFELARADYQEKDINVLCGTPSLKRLIELYDIHILKGKILIFEEENK